MYSVILASSSHAESRHCHGHRRWWLSCGDCRYRSDGQPLNATYPAGITLITWKATDVANQIATCIQTIKVRTTADVRVVIDPLINPIKVGKFLTYRVEITNHGPSPAIGVRLTDTIDEKSFLWGSWRVRA